MFSCLSYTAQGMMPPVVGWDLLHHLIFETTLQRHSQRPSWSGQILNWDSLLRSLLAISSWALKLTGAGGISTKCKKTGEAQGEKIHAQVTELTCVNQRQLTIHRMPPKMPINIHTLTERHWLMYEHMTGDLRGEHNPASSGTDDSRH